MLNTKGFTLIELMIVVSIFALILSLASISLSGLIPHTSFITNKQSLISDIKAQQSKAMIGNTNSTGDGSAYGIFLENNQYTLFTGSAYNPTAPNNFTIKLDATSVITDNTFPTNSIVFLQGSGELSSFNELNSSFSLQNSQTGETKIFKFNKIGVIIPE